jgi:hypothetical protein
MIIGWQWDRMLQYASYDNELTAFIVIFPLVPYLLFAVVAILAARSNNLGLILITFILSLAYFILIHSSDNAGANSSYIVPRIISFLLPLNMFIFSFIGKKKLKSVIIYSLIILFEFGIIKFLLYLIEFPESEMVVQFHIEFPKLAAALLGFTQQIYGIFFKTSFIENIPTISLFTI